MNHMMGARWNVRAFTRNEFGVEQEMELLRCLNMIPCDLNNHAIFLFRNRLDQASFSHTRHSCWLVMHTIQMEERWKFGPWNTLPKKEETTQEGETLLQNVARTSVEQRVSPRPTQRAPFRSIFEPRQISSNFVGFRTKKRIPLDLGAKRVTLKHTFDLFC